VFAKRALREIKLLKHFSGHDNITAVHDMDLEDPSNFNEMSFVLM
jgi:mitogen-activated protein kinase 7